MRLRLYTQWLAVVVALGMWVAEAAPLRVLFVGNSLTAANDLPSMLEKIGAANGTRIVAASVAFPNYSLEDHWQQGMARRTIAEGRWSFVVLQQGPSALPESRVLLVDFAKRFAKEASKAGARTALYMVWPSTSRAGDFDGVKLSYETAAREAGAIVLPAGEAWRVAWSRDPKLEFYGPDGFHPTTLGSYLAALVIYQGLTGKAAARPVAGLVSSAALAGLLQHAASQALGVATK